MVTMADSFSSPFAFSPAPGGNPAGPQIMSDILLRLPSPIPQALLNPQALWMSRRPLTSSATQLAPSSIPDMGCSVPVADI